MEHNWIHSDSDSPIPPLAVLGGHDSDGSPIFVGRAFHEGDNLPAKVVPSKNCAYVCWGGQEIAKTHYEVLVGDQYRWVTCSAGSVPLFSVRAGNTSDGEPLYVGRGHWEGSLTVGKIHPTHHCLYIPFGGEEQRLDSYEVLVHEQSHTWVPGSFHQIPPNAVVAGNDSDGSTIFVGRAYHDGENLPAKIVPNISSAYVSYGGHDIFKDEFEVLVGDGYYWSSSGPSGDIPMEAVSTGQTRNGERVYVGRGRHHDSLTPGKVHPNESCVYIPYGGKEIKVKSYEILMKGI